MTKRTGMILSRDSIEQNDAAISLLREQNVGHYWNSKLLMHRVLDKNVVVEMTTEPPQLTMAVYFLELDFDPCQSKMDHAESLSLVMILQMVLNTHSVEAGMRQKLHLCISNVFGNVEGF